MESFTTQSSEMFYSSLEAECVLAFNTVALCLRLLLNWWSEPQTSYFPLRKCSVAMGLSSCPYVINFCLKLCGRLLCLLSCWPAEVHDGTTEGEKKKTCKILGCPGS